MTTETQYPQPGPTGLPQFIRAEVERAIAKAVAPTGMSAHDGRALIGHDKLRYMLALIDSQAAKLAAIQAPEGAPELPTNEELEKLYMSHFGHPVDFVSDLLERWGPGLLGEAAAQVDLDRQDAARFRWLIDDRNWNENEDTPSVCTSEDVHWGDKARSLIDRHMKKD